MTDANSIAEKMMITNNKISELEKEKNDLIIISIQSIFNPSKKQEVDKKVKEIDRNLNDLYNYLRGLTNI